MKDKMTVEEFLNEMKEYYDAYYENTKGFDNSDDIVAVLDLSFKFYEQRRGNKELYKGEEKND